MATPDIKVKITAQGPGAADEAVAKAGGRKLATAAAAGLSPVQKLAQGIAKMDTREATRGVFALRTGLTQLAGQAIGTEGPVARLGEAVLGFGVGGAVTIGAVAGIGLIAAAWRAMTKDLRDATAGAAQASTTLEGFLTAKGPNVTAALKVSAVGQQLSDAQAKLAELKRKQTVLEANVQAGSIGADAVLGRQAVAEQQAAVDRLQQALNAANEALHRSQVGLDPNKEKLQTLATATAADDLRARLLLEGKSFGEVADAAERLTLRLQGLTQAQIDARVAAEHAAGAAHGEAALLTRFRTATSGKPVLAGTTGLRLHMTKPKTVATPAAASSAQEEMQDRLVAGGMDPEQARAQAAAAFGGGAPPGKGDALSAALSAIAGHVGGGAGQALSFGTGLVDLLRAPKAAGAAGAAGSGLTAAAMIPLALPLVGGLLSGLFGQKSVTIDGYSPTALAQMKESSGAGTLVAINAVGGDPRTTEYQIDRQQRRDDIVRIPTTRPTAGS